MRWTRAAKRKSAPPSPRPPRLWRITLGPLVWGLHFLVSYASTAVYCAKFAPADGDILAFRLAIGGLTLVALGGIAVTGWRAWRQWDFLDDYDYEHDAAVGEDRHEFLGHAGFLLAIIAFFGVVYVTLPVLFIGSCR